ncbi:hypothetical protein ACSMXN_14430 [Jatrophihabitans sp. DSM 45814]
MDVERCQVIGPEGQCQLQSGHLAGFHVVRGADFRVTVWDENVEVHLGDIGPGSLGDPDDVPWVDTFKPT